MTAPLALAFQSLAVLAGAVGIMHGMSSGRSLGRAVFGRHRVTGAGMAAPLAHAAGASAAVRATSALIGGFRLPLRVFSRSVTPANGDAVEAMA